MNQIEKRIKYLEDYKKFLDLWEDRCPDLVAIKLVAIDKEIKSLKLDLKYE